jgi:hypothetical protein
VADETLVGPKIAAGAGLLQVLDAELGDVFAAFWYRDPEADEWRLVIGSDLVDRVGPTAANRRLLEILKEHDTGLSPLEIDMVGRHHPRMAILRALRTQQMPLRVQEPIHIYRMLVGDQYVDDAYVYRTG